MRRPRSGPCSAISPLRNSAEYTKPPYPPTAATVAPDRARRPAPRVHTVRLSSHLALGTRRATIRAPRTCRRVPALNPPESSASSAAATHPPPLAQTPAATPCVHML